MKNILSIVLLCIFSHVLNAQENNPLINSGELIDKAVALHNEGKYKESIELYKKISRGDTNYYRAIYEMAFSQMLDSQFVAAKQTCETGFNEPNVHWADLYTLYGNLLDEMGDPQRALHIYDSAIHLYPAYTDLYLNKGTTLLRLNRYPEAEEMFKQSLLINPFLASSHYKIGECAMKQGRVVQAFLSYINYLLLQPAGRYQANCINALGSISKAGDDIKEQTRKRTEDLGDNFSTVEKIILSKIALDKQYKPLLKLDDPISRQIQVVFEKLEYDEKDPDFWMQYYVPLFKKFFTEKKFEPFIYRLFANVKIETIQDYIKKKEKVVMEVVDETVDYYNQLRSTRELNYAARKDMPALYHFDEGKLFGKGHVKDNGETFTGDWEFYYSPGNLRSKGVIVKQEKKMASGNIIISVD
jgi:tetratricopeptide (TPR) repeat protein